jgi:hypothetical protein
MLLLIICLCRLLWPKRYQVVQEIALRIRKGETVPDDGGSLGRGFNIRQLFDKATRLVTRRQARPHHFHNTGFVPPYDTRSRVLDSYELQDEARNAGYVVSNTGEVELSPGEGRVSSILTGRGSSFFGGAATQVQPQPSADGAVPHVAQESNTYGTNPVLLHLEREFSKNPRRHRADSGRVSCLSLPLLPR